MSMHRLSLSAAALFLPILPGHAGPCSSEIDRMQIRVDARVKAIAGAGPSAKESTAALLLARTREADRAGDKSACEQALADAQRAIGPFKA